MKRLVLPLYAALVIPAAPVWADEAPKKPWKNAAEVSVVSTNGNSKATSTSAKDTFNYDWTKTALELIAGALGSSNAQSVTAEQYNTSEKFSYMLTDDKKNYLFEKGGWEKNRFAGFNSRWDGSVGYGRQLLAVSSHTLVGELGEGYINEERINAPRNEFSSTRAYAKYAWILSGTSKFTQDGEYIHHNGDNEDYRANTETALLASVSRHLLLKVSYVWHHVGKPPAGIGKDDTITTAALVINY